MDVGAREIEVYTHVDLDTGDEYVFHVTLACGMARRRSSRDVIRLKVEDIKMLVERGIIQPDAERLARLAEAVEHTPSLLIVPVIVASTRKGSVLIDGTHRAVLIAGGLGLPAPCVLLTAAETRRCLIFGGTHPRLWDEACEPEAPRMEEVKA